MNDGVILDTFIVEIESMKIKTGMTALVVSLPILMSPPALADIYTPGIEYCKQPGNPCGIADILTPADKEYCREHPKECGIVAATPEYAENYCKEPHNPCKMNLATPNYAKELCNKQDNPCGIVVDTTNSWKKGWNTGNQEGITYCQGQGNPCGIADVLTEDDKRHCQVRPNECGIQVDPNDGSTTEGIQQCQNNPDSCKLEKKGSKAEGKAEGQKEAESSSRLQLLSLPVFGTDKTDDDISKECGEKDPVTCSFEKGKAEGQKEAESSSWKPLLSLSSVGNEKTEEDIRKECGEKDPVSCSFEKGKTEGIINCQDDPDSCQLEEKWSFEKGKTEGITKCQTDPDSCNLEEKWSFEKGKAEGQEATEASYQAQLLSVIDEKTDDIDKICQKYPISCSFEKGKAEGKAECKDNSASCGINVNQATALAITQTQACQKDQSSSVCGGLDKNKSSPYVFLSLPKNDEEPFGILYIPKLKVKIDEKKSETYKGVYLTWSPSGDGSIIFQFVSADETPTETPSSTDEPMT